MTQRKFPTCTVSREFHYLVTCLERATTKVALRSDAELLDVDDEAWGELSRARRWLYEHVEALEKKANAGGPKTTLRFL